MTVQQQPSEPALSLVLLQPSPEFVSPETLFPQPPEQRQFLRSDSPEAELQQPSPVYNLNMPLLEESVAAHLSS